MRGNLSKVVVSFMVTMVIIAAIKYGYILFDAIYDIFYYNATTEIIFWGLFIWVVIFTIMDHFETVAEEKKDE